MPLLNTGVQIPIPVTSSLPLIPGATSSIAIGNGLSGAVSSALSVASSSGAESVDITSSNASPILSASGSGLGNSQFDSAADSTASVTSLAKPGGASGAGSSNSVLEKGINSKPSLSATSSGHNGTVLNDGASLLLTKKSAGMAVLSSILLCLLAV